jgi:hypothetical protein
MSVPYNKQLLNSIVDAYQIENGPGPFTRAELAAWAILNNRWAPPLKSQIQLLSDEIATAMGTARKDVKGRKVRMYHCIQRELEDGTNQTLWCHFDLATPEFMEQSLSRRRNSFRNQNIQLHNDAVHTNEVKGTNIQLLLDYTDDIADYEHALSEKRDTSEQDILDTEF